MIQVSIFLFCQAVPPHLIINLCDAFSPVLLSVFPSDFFLNTCLCYSSLFWITIKLHLLMCGCVCVCGVPVSMFYGRCAEISLYCVYRCCIDLPSQTLVRLPRTMTAVCRTNSINSIKLLCETLITGILEARVQRQRCRRDTNSRLSRPHLITSQGDLIQGVLLFWDLYVCGDWLFQTESLHGAIAVRTISLHTRIRT